METEKPKDKAVAKPVPKDSEFTGEKIISYLMEAFQYKRRQSLAELLEVDDRTLTNWSSKSYADLNKQSARLKSLYDAVFNLDNAGIPQSAWLKLLQGELVGKGRTLIQAINSNPDNELLMTIIRLFSEKYFVDVPKSVVDNGLKKGKLSDDERQRIKATHRKF